VRRDIVWADTLPKLKPPLVLLAGRSLEEALNSVWTLLGTSFGLTVSTLVTAVRNELPLYQAIIVTDLVWLANYAIFMALATYNRHPRGSHMVQYAAIGQTYISMSCILYLWARAAALEAVGVTAGHTDKTEFIVVFHSTSATGTGRIVGLVVTSLLFLGYSVVAGIFFLRRIRFRPEHDTHIPLARRTSHPPAPATPVNANGTTRAHGGGPGTRPPPSLFLDPHLMTLSIFFVLPYVITVGSTEVQIRRNRLCSENTFWGFGQVRSVPPLFPFVADKRNRSWL
jgi:hypothetical protein